MTAPRLGVPSLQSATNLVTSAVCVRALSVIALEFRQDQSDESSSILNLPSNFFEGKKRKCRNVPPCCQFAC